MRRDYGSKSLLNFLVFDRLSTPVTVEADTLRFKINSDLRTAKLVFTNVVKGIKIKKTAKIKSELCKVIKCTREVSGLSRNGSSFSSVST